MKKVAPTGVLPEKLTLDLLDKYLVTDKDFWEETVVCMNIQQSEKLEDKAERLRHLKRADLYKNLL